VASFSTASGASEKLVAESKSKSHANERKPKAEVAMQKQEMKLQETLYFSLSFPYTHILLIGKGV